MIFNVELFSISDDFHINFLFSHFLDLQVSIIEQKVIDGSSDYRKGYVDDGIGD